MSDDQVRDAFTPPIVSFAQNAEDIRLLRVLESVESGFFVDVGAADPVVGSVTQLFVLRGWHGINIEPGPLFDDLVLQRPNDVNLNCVVGSERTEVPFYLTFPDLGMSTLDMAAHQAALEHVERFEVVQRQQAPLRDVLGEHRPQGPIHFLKVDVEGAEAEVLASNDWVRFRPWIVLVEAIMSWSRVPTHDQWEHLLLDSGYSFAGFDGINRFYVASEHAALVERIGYPISPLDRYIPFDSDQAMTRLVEAEFAAWEAETVAREATAARRATWDRLTRDLADGDERIKATEQERDQARALAATQSELVAAILNTRAWRAAAAMRSVAAPAKRVLGPMRRLALDAMRGRERREAGREETGPDEGRPDPPTSPRSPLSPTDTQSPLAPVSSLLPSPVRLLDDREAACISAAARRLTYLSAHEAQSPTVDQDGRAALNELQLACAFRLDSRESWRASLARPSAAPADVVVDARCLQDPNYRSRGVGYHGRSILAILRAVAGDLRIAAILDPSLPDLDSTVRDLVDTVVYSASQVQVETTRLFVGLSPLTDGPGSSVPFLRCPTTRCVAVLYDFIPAQQPHRYLTEATASIEYNARLNVLAAFEDGLAISEDTATAAQTLLGWESHQIMVTGVIDPLPDRSSRSAMPTRRFVVAPTGGDTRKNLPGAVEAFSIAFRNSPDIDLMVVGSIPEHWVPSLQDLALRYRLSANRLVFRSNLDPDALADIYRDAEVAIVPSLAEGFSLPVVEAARRGCPVVASDIPAHRELLGTGWWLCTPNDLDGFAEALTRASNDRDPVAQTQRGQVEPRYAPAVVSERVRRALTQVLEKRAQPERGPLGQRQRPKIAVIGPLPPQHSGIADYTAYTLTQLQRYADLTFVSSVQDPVSIDVSPVSQFSYEKLLPGNFDQVIAVMGNSHFHLSVLEYLEQLGGAVIGHDTRMIEFYDTYRDTSTLTRVLGLDSTFERDAIDSIFTELDTLPASGYADIARLASPLIVHSSRLARTICEETSVRPIVVPFVPYNIPSRPMLTWADVSRARRRLGLAESGVLHVVALGGVDTRTKAVDIVVRALAWLQSWGRRCRFHVVGDVSWQVRAELEDLATALGVAESIQFAGRVPRTEWQDYMVGADVSVQLRTASVLSLSGALADAIAYGLPTLTTDALAQEHDAPFFVHQVSPAATPVLVAGALDEFHDLRRSRFADIEASRVQYLATHGAEDYACRVADALGLRGR